MQMISIVPQPMLELTENQNMHLVLAQCFGEKGFEKYTEFYKQEAKKGKHLIMDNGAAEGVVVPFETVLKKAGDVGAEEVVVTDAYKDSYGTVLNLDKAMRTYEGYENMGAELPGLFVVPQGKTQSEWLSCAEYMVRNYPVRTIGIPKHLIDTCKCRDARLVAISELVSRIDLTGINIHLLGCWTTPIEVLTVAKASKQGTIPPVRSCDSALAYIYARAGKHFDDCDRPDHEPIDFMHGEADRDLVKHNIADWENVGNTTPIIRLAK